jgi:hypothetical protein
MRDRSGRGWVWFSAIGIPLWIGATVLATVTNEDPTDPAPTLVTFVVGGALFFGLMFGGALWQQLRMRADTGEARFGRGVAIGYSITGAVVTALGLAAIWKAGVEGENAAIFIVPLVGVVVLWAIAAVLILGRYSR